MTAVNIARPAHCSAMPTATLSPVYGPEGKEGEGVQQREESAFACVENFGQVREESSGVNVVNVVQVVFLLKFSAKTGVLGHLARHGEFGADEHLRVSVGAGQHQLRKFRNRHATTHCSAMQRRGTIAPKAKAPVLENTFEPAVAAPTESGVLSRPDFLGVSTFGRAHGFGRDGFVRKAGRTAGSVFSTSRPPAALENVACGSESQPGASAMTASPVASHSAAPDTQATTEETRAFALLQATSDATMAKLYLSKGNIAAARRKAVQLLKALQQLEVTA